MKPKNRTCCRSTESVIVAQMRSPSDFLSWRLRQAVETTNICSEPAGRQLNAVDLPSKEWGALPRLAVSR